MDISENKEIYKNSLLYKVAWLYYIDQLTQKEIADKLSVSRIKVLKMLEEAREKKIVNFHFSTYGREKIKLERDLIAKYGLKDVFIAPWSTEDNINESLGQAAAMYLDDFLEDETYIGVGYGDTVGHIIQNLTKISNKNLSIISMTGGVTPYLRQINMGISRLNLYLAPAPLIMSSKDVAKAILKEKPVKDILDMAEQTQVIVTGIGGMNQNATVLTSRLLTKIEFEKLKMNSAVGDIFMHFIDKEGKLVDTEIEERIISTKLDKLQKRENVIAVAGGKAKIEVIRTAINFKYIDTLITDETTAQLLLEG